MRRFSTLTILVAGAFVASAAALAAPEPVSPAGAVAQRCPTFSWSAVRGASGYELVVYGVSDDAGDEPLLSAVLPGGATAWTPGAGCLTAGGQYAWTLRVRGEDETGWSDPVLFEVAAMPSLGEVEAALATLRRYLEATREAAPTEAKDAVHEEGPGAAGDQPVTPSGAVHQRSRAAMAEGGALQNTTAAAVPSLGAPSLTVDANIALGAASNFFKEGTVFLWDDMAGNTALGHLALASATGDATRNTAVGREALRFTVAGGSPTEGSDNTAVGFQALRANTTGRFNTAAGSQALLSNTEGVSNTAVGSYALYQNETGNQNTAIGQRALRANTTGYGNTANGSSALFTNVTGDRNTALGSRALLNTTGDDNLGVGYEAGMHATSGSGNIFISNVGVAGDSGKIRIGTQGTQDGTFVAGIRGTTTGNADAVTVVIDSAGQLGTVSSSQEVKQDIREIGTLSQRLLELEPVAFRYRQHAERDPDTPLQFGLVAEEVAEVFPELVVRDDQGRPRTVKYHLLASLLLNELQRAEEELAAQGEKLDAIREELTGLARPAEGRK